MDVSAEAADLVVKEGLQATETAVKLAGSGIKNVAALLLALSKQDYKVIGQASAARLARDPNPPAVVQIRAEDLSRFRKMAAKQYGVLYLPVRKRGDDSGLITIVSTQTYAANLNCIMEELGYPVPVKETDEPKKAVPFAPSEKASNERGSISTASQERTTDDARSSVLEKLEAMRQLSTERNTDRIKVKEHIR